MTAQEEPVCLDWRDGTIRFERDLLYSAAHGERFRWRLGRGAIHLTRLIATQEEILISYAQSAIRLIRRREAIAARRFLSARRRACYASCGLGLGASSHTSFRVANTSRGHR